MIQEIDVKRLLLFPLLALPMLTASAQPLEFVTEHYPPFQIAEKGKPLAGFAVDVVAELQRRAGTTAEVKALPWARAYKLAQSRANTFIFTIAETQERLEEFEWVGNYYAVSEAYFARADRDDIVLDAESDAPKYRLAMPRGPGFIKQMEEAGFKLDDVKTVNSQSQAIGMLHKGRVDLNRNNTLGFYTEVERLGLAPEDFEVALVFNTTQMGIATNKKTPAELVQKLREALAELEQDGTLDKLKEKWLPR